MSLYRLPSGLLPNGDLPPGSRHGPPRRGHDHFWHRALSRRHLVRTAAGATAIALGASRWAPRSARAAQMEGAEPKPIPGGFDPMGTGEIIHIYLPEPGLEQSLITDFRGHLGVALVGGEGTVTEGVGQEVTLVTGTPVATADRLVFDADIRFMQGLYVGEDGQEHQGAFALI